MEVFLLFVIDSNSLFSNPRCKTEIVSANITEKVSHTLAQSFKLEKEQPRMEEKRKRRFFKIPSFLKAGKNTAQLEQMPENGHGESYSHCNLIIQGFS